MISPSTDVFLLSAGLGTRLRPLTNSSPKPLIKVGSRNLIERHLERLRDQGFRRVMINLHYLPEMIRTFVGDGSRWKLEASFSEEPVLLDTGGGIKNVESWVRSENLLILNSDSLFDDSLDLRELVAKQAAGNAVMTLLVGPPTGSFTKLWIDAAGRLQSFAGATGPAGTEGVNYLGGMVISNRLFPELPLRGKPFSLTADVIPGLLSRGERIDSVRFDGFWSDIGTPERLDAASKYLGEHEAQAAKV